MQPTNVTVPALAIVAIAAIELYAPSRGINGHLMMMTMGLIALVAGVKLRDWWDKNA
mgnify:CR=1 FL=1